jgi:hypothetical protein
MLIISLNFAVFSEYNYDMSEDSTETARQRATRIWRNGWIQRRSEPQNQEQIPLQTVFDQERLLNQGRTKLIAAINKVFNEHKHELTLEYYKSAINSRRRKLLEEKLRRLESKHE